MLGRPGNVLSIDANLGECCGIPIKCHHLAFALVTKAELQASGRSADLREVLQDFLKQPGIIHGERAVVSVEKVVEGELTCGGSGGEGEKRGDCGRMKVVISGEIEKNVGGPVCFEDAKEVVHCEYKEKHRQGTALKDSRTNPNVMASKSESCICVYGDEDVCYPRACSGGDDLEKKISRNSIKSFYNVNKCNK